MRSLLVWLLCIITPAACWGAAAEYTIATVRDGHTLITTTGETITLVGLYTPSLRQDGKGNDEPMGKEAKELLERLTVNRTITPPAESTRDRHGRLNGQIYSGDTWLQGEMVRKGMAMVFGYAHIPPETATALLQLEQAARKEKLGIWSVPNFQVLTPEQAEAQLDRYRLVEGKVVSVHPYHGSYYINFFNEWRGKFSLYVSRKHADIITTLPKLEGRTILARGWIYYHNAPSMAITRADMIELKP